MNTPLFFEDMFSIAYFAAKNKMLAPKSDNILTDARKKRQSP